MLKKIDVGGNYVIERDFGIEGEIDFKNDTNLIINGNAPLG